MHFPGDKVRPFQLWNEVMDNYSQIVMLVWRARAFEEHHQICKTMQPLSDTFRKVSRFGGGL